MEARILVAGRGGMGAVGLGYMLTVLYLKRGYHVSMFPTYGPETRGGLVVSMVSASTDPVDNPVVEEADVLICMDGIGLTYLDSLKEGGLLLYVDELVEPPNGKFYKFGLPALKMAEEVATEVERETGKKFREKRIFSNTVMFGVYARIIGFAEEEAKAVVKEVFGGKKPYVVEVNMRAVSSGYKAAMLSPK